MKNKKPCKRCGVNPRSPKPSGPSYSYCKKCDVERAGVWAKNNVEKNRAKALRHYHKKRLEKLNNLTP